MSASAEPPFDRLEVLDDQPAHGAAFNMALDEVLLREMVLPLLRIYRWERPAVSFGYFTPWHPVFSRFPGRDLVRRWTGGGVVEHGDDVTFSLLVPRNHWLSNGRAGESYRVIHAALRTALMRLGWTTELLADDTIAQIRDTAANPCFIHPVQDDLLSDGQKISGGAQRRTRDGLLHQGSVLPPAGTRLDAAALTDALPAALARKLMPRRLTPSTQAAAQILADEKYAAAGWAGRV